MDAAQYYADFSIIRARTCGAFGKLQCLAWAMDARHNIKLNDCVTVLLLQSCTQ